MPLRRSLDKLKARAPQPAADDRRRVELPLYPAQERIKAEARRFNVLDVGRRAGKTYLGQHLAIECSCAGHPVGWFAPNYKYLLEVWETLTRLLRPLSERINATERRIELSNGGVIECWTLDGTDDPGRSRKYKLAIIDEAAIASNLKTVWENAIRPTITDLEGSAWFLSTPKGLNFFHELWKRGQDPIAYPDWRSWQMPSSVNPHLSESEIEAARLELPELVFKQEYLAEFLQEEGAVFRNVEACLTSLPTTPAEHRSHFIVGGVDWGRSHDFTALSLFCCHCCAEVCLDRFNQVGWQMQRDRILAQLTAWGVKYVNVEKNSIGSPNLEALQDAAPDEIILAGFETTSKSKTKLIQQFALAFEKLSARWLPDPVGRHELVAYEATITESGYTKYPAPSGQFDDTVIARALAWKAAEAEMPVALTPEEKLQAELDRDFSRLSYVNRLRPGEHVYTEREQMDAFALDFWRSRQREKQRDVGRTWSSNVCDPDDNPWRLDG